MGGIFTDDQIAGAMIDRLAHHGYLLPFQGESYRMAHALMKERLARASPSRRGCWAIQRQTLSAGAHGV